MARITLFYFTFICPTLKYFHSFNSERAVSITEKIHWKRLPKKIYKWTTRIFISDRSQCETKTSRKKKHFKITNDFKAQKSIKSELFYIYLLYLIRFQRVAATKYFINLQNIDCVENNWQASGIHNHFRSEKKTVTNREIILELICGKQLHFTHSTMNVMHSDAMNLVLWDILRWNLYRFQVDKFVLLCVCVYWCDAFTWSCAIVIPSSCNQSFVSHHQLIYF